MISTFIIAPILGGVIGYITNDLAIRMLFRPHRPKYIFGHRVPFTPGLIPKEKDRIAQSIGATISQNLMNHEVLEKTLLSAEMIGKIRNGIDTYVAKQQSNTESLREYLVQFVEPELLDKMLADIQTELGQNIVSQLQHSGLGEKISKIAVNQVVEKMSGGFMGMFGADKFVKLLASPAEDLLKSQIDELLENHAGVMVDEMLAKQGARLLETPVCQLLEGHESQLAQARDWILGLYRKIICEQLPTMLHTLNISRMVEERIKEMDVEETERLILEVMNKELRAIVWLGAFLGAIMGSINCFF